MAKTKKEIQTQNPEEDQSLIRPEEGESTAPQTGSDLPTNSETHDEPSELESGAAGTLNTDASQTGLEADASQTDTELVADYPPADLDPALSQTGSKSADDPSASLADLELSAAGTLDPDASLTDLEAEGSIGDFPAGQDPLSQTGHGSEEDQEMPPQSDNESELPLQTGMRMSEGADTGNSTLQTDPGLSKDTDASEAPPGGNDSDAPPVKRRRARKKAAEPSPSNENGDEDAADGQTDPEQSKKLRMPGRRRQRVVSIDAERTVATDTDKLRNDLLDLVESLKGKKILTGTIQGVERLSDNPEMSYAVVYHGDFKVIIPVLEAIEEPADYRDQPRGDVLHYLLNKRLGAEVDYIVKGVDQESNVVAASRLEAMALKRREYYFRTDRDGNFQIYEGIRAEARVVSVIRAGIFIDLFGVECYIPLRELSYQRWVDAAAHYQPGQRVLVKVLEVDRSDRNRPRVSASVKQAMDNPYEKALKKYVVGNRYVGTVSMVDLNGVFVSLDGGIDCLCTYPKRGRPPRGARATVRILGINRENNRIWGVITHMSTMR